MVKLSKKQKQYLEVGVVLLIALFSIVFWNSIIIYPIKFFVVLSHEISHGVMAILTGGKIVSLDIQANLGGECVSNGGIKILIASAGYLGSLTIGSLLFISGYIRKLSLWVCSILSVLIILFLANFMSSSLQMVFALFIAALLFISPRFFNPSFNSYLLKTLGLISSLYVLIDIKEDLLTLTYRQSDAQLIADVTGIDAVVWGGLWFLISIVAVFYLFKFSFIKGFKK